MVDKKLITKIQQNGYWKEIPGRKIEIEQFLEKAFTFLFPSSNKGKLTAIDLGNRYQQVQHAFINFYCPVGNDVCNRDINFEIRFFKELSEIYDLLLSDAKAIFNADPAAMHIDQVVHIYPGFYAVFIHRLAHLIYKLKKIVISRILSEYAHRITGVDIHPGASIGHSFSIDHGTGIVIGETSVIGNNVKVYQGVTLGAKFVNKSLTKVRRHPTIEDNVVIYSNASILGGDTIIGQNSIIGGNVFLLKSVAPNSLVYQENEIRIKNQNKEIKQEV